MRLRKRELTRCTAIWITCLVLLKVGARAEVHPVPLGKNPDTSQCVTCHTDKNHGKYVHSAIAMGCATCHEVVSAKGVTLISLVAPASALCFTCHQKSSDRVLHGPYGEGLCVACHSPHSSDFPDQLLADRQDLCLGCHARDRLHVNVRRQKVTTPWGVTLTFAQMKGWQFLGLNKTLTANHPVEGHPVSGPNTALGNGEITCLSCHQPHSSPRPNLIPSGHQKSKPNILNQGVYTMSLCDTCHNPLSL